jgi:3,4-dihydroxy 2-butanone 4-phosphate synthase/GTP cyclohydrolase II
MTTTVSNENIVQLSPNTDKVKYTLIEQAIEDIKNGKFVIVADDEGRENEGDLICAAEKMTPEMMNFMLTHARGMVCVAMTPERAAELKLVQMVDENTDPHQTAFTVSVDAGYEFGVTTGVSAKDRAITAQHLASPNASALDFRRPGHMFPVQAKNGGVFRRIGHTEAAIDMSRIAGLAPVGVICEILNEDGNMARRDDLAAFAKKHGLSFVTIAQLIQYRLQHERSITRRVAKEIETRFGTFTAIGYKDSLDGCEHLALVKGSIEKLSETVPYIRVQHEDVIDDMLGKADDDMPREMALAMRAIQNQESGAIIYLRYNLVDTLNAYKKPDAIAHQAYENNKADLREYGVGAQILADLGVGRFKMLTQSKKKIIALRGYGLEIVETIPLSKDDFDYSLPPKIELPSSAIFAEKEAAVQMTTTALTPVAEEAPVVVAPVAVAPVITITTQNVATPVEAAPVETFVETPAEEAVQETAPVVAAPVVAPVVAQEVTPEQPKPVEAVQTAPVQAAPAPVKNVTEIIPELKAEPRFATMKMGGQIMSGQALFEG